MGTGAQRLRVTEGAWLLLWGSEKLLAGSKQRRRLKCNIYQSRFSPTTLGDRCHPLSFKEEFRPSCQCRLMTSHSVDQQSGFSRRVQT